LSSLLQSCTAPYTSSSFSRASSPFFVFTDPATTDLCTLSLHDALPIYARPGPARLRRTFRSVGHPGSPAQTTRKSAGPPGCPTRSEEHTSELQSLRHLVCRLLLEKKKKKTKLGQKERHTTQCTALSPT